MHKKIKNFIIKSPPCFKEVFFKKLDLSNKEERKEYSLKLQYLEKQFVYPLADSTFRICHGLNSDYFSFFEQLGKPFFYVFEKENNIIGCICFILRNIENEKIWYICDLKVAKENRDKRILLSLYAKIYNELKNICPLFYFVNMSPEKNNGLLFLSKKILFNFSIETKPIYFYQTNIELFRKQNSIKLDQSYLILNNRNKKDLIIDENVVSLHHIAHKDLTKNYLSFDETFLSEVNEKDLIMLCSFKPISFINNEAKYFDKTEGILSSNKIEKFVNFFSGFEI